MDIHGASARLAVLASPRSPCCCRSACGRVTCSPCPPFRGKPLVEALVAVPLVLPPTVLGFYLLVPSAPARRSARRSRRIAGQTLAFSFPGPAARLGHRQHPVRRAADSAGVRGRAADVREAAACCGLTPWQRFLRIEIPLAWPGILTAAMLAFAHTLGEFGVVLMVGGNIPARRAR
jgi:molybdate transport system permease protein